MMRSRDSLILAFAALAMLSPAMAAPSKLPVKAAPTANVDRALQLMREADDARGKGDKALAYRMAEAAIVADPARPEAYDLLGDLYAADNEADFARFYYYEALSIDPNDPGAVKAMAQLDHGATREAQEASPARK